MPYIIIMLFSLLALLTPTIANSKVKQTKLKLTTAKQANVPKSIITDSLSIKKERTEIFDDPNLGAIVSYKDNNHPMMVVSYYVYPMSDENISAEYLMPLQYEGIKSEIEEAQKHNGNTTVLLTESIHNVGTHETFYNKHNIVGESGDLISETYLTHDNFHYLKLRISFPTFKASEYNPLSAELADLLIGNTDIEEHKNSSIIISLNGNIEEQSRQTIILMQLAYLSQIKNKIESNGLIIHFEQISEIMDTVAEVSKKWTEKQEKISNLIYFHEIKQAGFLNEFIWSFMRQPHWNEPTGLKMSDFNLWFIPFKEMINSVSDEFGRLVIVIEK